MQVRQKFNIILLTNINKKYLKKLRDCLYPNWNYSIQ